jgi:hypothetical protein
MDACGGGSGGPAFTWWDDQYWLVGLFHMDQSFQI